MKIAVLQLSPVAGGTSAAADAILDAWDRARDAGADLAITPELAVCGYTPRDLLLRDDVLDRIERQIARLADASRGRPPLLLGAPTRRPGRDSGLPLHNSALFLVDGSIRAARHKRLLPTYDVFDEARWFEPGPLQDPIDWMGERIGVTICEDIWNDRTLHSVPRYADDPVESLVQRGASVIVNLSASPWEVGKQHARLHVLSHAARRHAVPVVWANQVGAHDELLFDGNSLHLDRRGRTVAQAPAFATAVTLFDTDRVADDQPKHEDPRPDPIATEVLEALTMGVRDFFARTGFRTAVLGLSGGIDSAVVAAIACRALGPDNVVGIAMPGRYSSDHSVDDAIDLAERLGLRLHRISIEPAFAALLDSLAPAFGDRAPDLAEENLQARIRGVLVMSLANKLGALALTTGNKSELATGYCTLYGDMCGALAPIADCPKTLVYRLAHRLNDPREVIPASTITKPPSAELRPGQLDQDSLPPYDLLDAILEALVEDDRSVDDLVRDGFDRDTVARVHRLVCLSEHKRKQAAPGLRISRRAFGVGRRLPIAADWSDLLRRLP